MIKTSALQALCELPDNLGLRHMEEKGAGGSRCCFSPKHWSIQSNGNKNKQTNNNNKKNPADPWQFYKDKNLRSFPEVPLGSRPSPNWSRCE